MRINGSEVRAKVIGEGANLGVTQLGRIEYAQAGGRINTDAIDNSAGVDTSDHEVNLKILLGGPLIAAARSVQDRRDALLAAMTDDVAAHGAGRQLRPDAGAVGGADARQRAISTPMRRYHPRPGSARASSTARWNSCPTTPSSRRWPRTARA